MKELGNDDLRAQPLALIGIGCRLPGGITSPSAYWRLLAEGRDAVTEIPRDRWDVDAYYDPEPRVPGRMSSSWGGFLRGVHEFDAAFFGVGAEEAAAMDPRHRLLAQVAFEALEHAGIAPASLAGGTTGLFAGLSGEVARVSRLLGLRGPSIAVDTACSSALTALHLAAASLRLHECDLALVGGVSLILGPDKSISLSGKGLLSSSGRCRAFDAQADGLVRSEGCGVVVLKRLTNAVHDGDRVLAVLRSSAVGQGGLSPLFRRALAAGGVDPAEVGMVETHGSGSPVGDAEEFGALKEVYGSGRARCALGSVKTNLGHTEAASGIASLIKAVLALRAGVVPANLHFTGWNPKIHPDGTGLFVPTSAEAWPRQGSTRLAAVSAFGYTGTNAHVLLEQAPQQLPRPAVSGGRVLVPLSASTPRALTETATRLADWLEEDGADSSVQDVAHTLTRRQHRPIRAVLTAADTEELVAALRMCAGGATPTTRALGSQGPVWLFSGEGSEWAGMGTELLRTETAFAATIAELEPLVAKETGLSVAELITAREVVTGADRVRPALFAMQVALAATWRDHGVEPAAVIGHSLGEVAAAVVAGTLPLHEAVAVACHDSTDPGFTRFTEAVTAAVEDGHTTFVEIAPHPLLTRSVAAIAQHRVATLEALRRNDSHSAMLTRIAAAQGLDLTHRHPDGELLDLPPTAWDRAEHRAPTADPVEPHPLLGQHTEVPGDGRHVWQANVGMTALPWLAEHRIDGVAVLPNAAYCEMALASAAELFACTPDEIDLRDLEFHQCLELAEHTKLSTMLTPEREDLAKFEAFDSAGTRLASATVRHHIELRVEPQTSTDSLTRVRVPPAVRGVSTKFAVHPVLLDMCFDLLGLEPAAVGSLRLHGDPRRAEYCRAAPGEGVTLYSRDGTVLLSAKDIVLPSPIDRDAVACGQGWSRTGVLTECPPLRVCLESTLIPEALAAQTGQSAHRILEDRLIAHIRAILKLPASTPLEPDTPLLDLGFDSVMAAELRTRIERSLGVLIPIEPLWSPGALATHISTRLGLPGRRG